MSLTHYSENSFYIFHYYSFLFFLATSRRPPLRCLVYFLQQNQCGYIQPRRENNQRFLASLGPENSFLMGDLRRGRTSCNANILFGQPISSINWHGRRIEKLDWKASFAVFAILILLLTSLLSLKTHITTT